MLFVFSTADFRVVFVFTLLSRMLHRVELAFLAAIEELDGLQYKKCFGNM